jgi:uncharacterized protein (TIRG00374 family)
LRPLAIVAVGALLSTAVWFQRGTIGSALDELRSMSTVVVVVLVLLAVVERVTRADIIRHLLSEVSFGRAFMIHDVGASASKGIPLGGPIAAGLRYSIARDAEVAAPRFWSALLAYGVVTTFVTWTLPLGVIALDVSRRQPTATDLAMLGVCALVVGGATVFWAVVLGSERVTERIVRLVRRITTAASHRIPALVSHDAGAALLEIRASLRRTARRPAGVVVRTALAQAVGAVILLVALRELGVGAELGTLEFARVFFVVTLLSSFVPVPGGVGVVEVGLTGALVAAGVAAPTALAGVLVYRLLTYVTPIVVGAALYAVWRVEVRRRRPEPAVAEAPTAAPVTPATAPALVAADAVVTAVASPTPAPALS